MTGNEPFTRISLVVDTNTVYLLEGKEEVLKMLKSHQGEYADISFNQINDVPEGGKALVIVDAVIKSKDKGQ